MPGADAVDRYALSASMKALVLVAFLERHRRGVRVI